MNRRALVFGIIFGIVLADILADLYFAAKRDNVSSEIADYLGSIHGRFEQFYAERSRGGRTDRRGANAAQGRSIRSRAEVDYGNGASRTDADGRS